MARAFTLGTLVGRCQQRADKENDSHIETPEWKALISEYYGELHALIVEKGARYFETEATITATGATSYALPADHLSTIGVDFVLNGTTGPRRPVYGPIAVQHRARLLGHEGTALYFGLEAANIALYPVPSSGTYKHLYVPQPTDLSASGDSTSVDLINVYGEKFVIWGVASVALHKGSASQVRAVDEYNRASAQVEYWATLRALNQPSYRVQEDDLETMVSDPADWRYRG